MAYTMAFNQRNILTALPTAVLSARDRDSEIFKYGQIIQRSNNPKTRLMAFQDLSLVSPEFQQAQIEKLADNMPQRELQQLQKKYYQGKINEMETRIQGIDVGGVNWEGSMLAGMFGSQAASEFGDRPDSPGVGGEAADYVEQPFGEMGPPSQGSERRRQGRVKRMGERSSDTQNDNPLFLTQLEIRQMERSGRKTRPEPIATGGWRAQLGLPADVPVGEAGQFMVERAQRLNPEEFGREQGTLEDASVAIQRRVRGRPKLTTEQREDPALQERRRESALKGVSSRRERQMEAEVREAFSGELPGEKLAYMSPLPVSRDE